MGQKLTAHRDNSHRRKLPKGAKCQTAQTAKLRRMPNCVDTLRDSAPFGIWRRLEFGAVWEFAPLGSLRL
jgi:hypothetical protein